MQMKKRIIAAMAGVMILAVAAPALAANVGGGLEFGYTITDPKEVSNTMGLNINGNISEDVSFKIGFGDDLTVFDTLPAPTEAWIQANDTLVGTVKFGAFDLAFGHGNDAAWAPANPLNVQVDNELGGVNLSAGVQFDATGEWNVIGAAASLEPMESLFAKVGVLSENGGDMAVGYEVAYAGIDNLELGLKGNLADEEIVADAGYEFMPGIKATGLYGQKTANADNVICENLTEVGVKTAFENGLHAGASYEMSDQGGTDHKIIRVNGGYDYKLAEGLTVGIEGSYAKDDQLADAATSIGVNAGIAF